MRNKEGTQTSLCRFFWQYLGRIRIHDPSLLLCPQAALTQALLPSSGLHVFPRGVDSQGQRPST